jgi:hypothetical protein
LELCQILSSAIDVCFIRIKNLEAIPMKMIRTACFPLLLTSLLWFAPVVSPVARQGVDHRSDVRRLSALPPTGRILPEAHSAAIRAYNYRSLVYTFSDAPPSTDTSGGIREDIPDQYRAKYQKWKTEFLSTETGRRQWEMYAQNPQFTLTIAVSSDNRHGASTNPGLWLRLHPNVRSLILPDVLES